MNSPQQKRHVAIYTPTYLTSSMTFVYNQLQGVSSCFSPLVFCENIQNFERFPFSPVYPKKKSISGRALSYMNRLTGRRFTSLSPGQTLYWQRISREKRVQLIHAHFGPSGIEILPLARSLKIPLLVTFHGYDASTFLKKENYVESVKSLSNYAEFLCVSEDMKQRLISLGVSEERIATHYIGIPVEKFKYVDRASVTSKLAASQEVVFLQVSNFVEKKGHEYTVKAFSEIVALCPMARLVLAGDGPLRKNTEALVKDLGLEGKVMFAGSVDSDEVYRLMASADVFLHHSVTASNGDKEGIPTVLMEAMATGLPVVSTYHSGIPELIIHNKNGFLVEEKDVHSYTNQLKTVLSMNKNIGGCARDRIESMFNLSVQNDKLNKIYKRVIDNAGQ